MRLCQNEKDTAYFLVYNNEIYKTYYDHRFTD